MRARLAMGYMQMVKGDGAYREARGTFRTTIERSPLQLDGQYFHLLGLQARQEPILAGILMLEEPSDAELYDPADPVELASVPSPHLYRDVDDHVLPPLDAARLRHDAGGRE